MRIQANIQRIQRDIEALTQFTASPGAGVTRFSFTAEDRQAREYIKSQMAASHLTVYEDAAGTIVGRREGSRTAAPAVMIGSHFDSVKNGGPFDGPAGVVAALEIARVLDENRIATEYPLEFIAMIEEEGGRFGAGLFGSRAMTGKIPPDELLNYHDDAGISVARAMQDFGLKPEALLSAVRSPDQLKAFLELHIEQGPILEKTGTDVGLVETVVGIEQWEIEIQGRPDHAGTTPMNMRADALVAAADVIKQIYRLASQSEAGTVATVGKLLVSPGAGNIVPGKATFSVDIRSDNATDIQQLGEAIKEFLFSLAQEYPGILTRMSPVLSIDPTPLSSCILQIFEEEAGIVGITSRRMRSGAGHDAMVMASLTEVGLVFVPSRDGRSHCPEEWTDYYKLKKGVDLVLKAALRLAVTDYSCCD
jgi:allantoate deiminase